jgi:hypothetical protein
MDACCIFTDESGLCPFDVKGIVMLPEALRPATAKAAAAAETKLATRLSAQAGAT